MGILRHIWQALKDLAQEIRDYRADVREARQRFRAGNGLDLLPEPEPPTEIIEIIPMTKAAELPQAEPEQQHESKTKRRAR